MWDDREIERDGKKERGGREREREGKTEIERGKEDERVGVCMWKNFIQTTHGR